MDTNAAFSVKFVHRLRFTREAFDPYNPVLAEAIAPEGESRGRGPVRTLVVVDQGVAERWPYIDERVRGYADAYTQHIALAEPILTVPGGEACKNDAAVIDRICAAIHDAELCRQSCVVAIGGGALLDAVGFAAAISHRGVRLVRLPTTTLSQADSSVGVKNGVNRFGKKNFLGAFTPPWAVVHDELFLSTLSGRDWRCGFSEVLKVALVKDRAFFETLAVNAPALRQRNVKAAGPILRRSARLHLAHIVEGGDAFELTRARPLDFGHWAAHKIEQLTGFSVRHGEAVAMGVALDTTYAALTGILPWGDARLVLDTITALGLETYHEAMADTGALLAGLDEFRQHLGGRLCVPMLAGIGCAIDVHEIDPSQMALAVKRLAAGRAADDLGRMVKVPAGVRVPTPGVRAQRAS